jgi:GAF domain-containing protein
VPQAPANTQNLRDPRRLNTLKSLMLMDTPTEQIFDRLTRLASRLVNAPVSLVSLVDGDRQWFKSAVGLPEPWASQRQTPLSHSFCQHVVNSQSPLVVNDARRVDFLKTNLAITDLSVIGYLGMPLTTSDGHTLGSFCVIDDQPRQWTDNEIEILEDLAATAISLIEMRGQLVNLTSQSDSKIRNAMGQLTQAEARRKEEQESFRTLLDQVAHMVRAQRPASEVLAVLETVNR